jgi:hypothetical protein
VTALPVDITDTPAREVLPAYDETIGAPSDSALASPLTLLLEEEAHGDRQATDILAISYTCDLGFFEAFALGPAQSCGARTTLVGDLAVAAPDVRAARSAGRAYLPGQATCAGAFHPKLFVITGPERTTVAIGSGNTTLAGWQGNAELWTVLRALDGRSPELLADLAGWLQALPDRVRLSPHVPQALQRVAGQLVRTHYEGDERTDPQVRLVSSLHTPILEQLPTGPVQDLAVSAPFHDPSAAALTALVERLQPAQLRIAFQPRLTQLDGPKVNAIVQDHGGQLIVDGESGRYRHGKLVQWTDDQGQRWALTGSANVTGAALCKSVADGGNCELGLISPVGADLLPAGSAATGDIVSAARSVVRGSRPAGHSLLGAVRTDQGVRVVFATTTSHAGHLELSPAAAPPEYWERLATVASGTVDIEVPLAIVVGGSRIRFVHERDGVTVHSNLVFVADPHTVDRRPGTSGRSGPAPTPPSLFADERLADRFHSDLQLLKAALLPMTTGGGGSSGGGSGSGSGPAPRTVGWEEYLEAAQQRLGSPLLRFALGLPALGSGGEQSREPVGVSWIETGLADNEVGLDDDTAEVAAEELDPTADRPGPPDLRTQPQALRRRYQRWAQRLVEVSDGLGPAERLLVVRLLLWTAAAGAWEEDDPQWTSLLAQALQQLAAAELPESAEPHAGSLAAVALAVLRSVAPRAQRTQQTLHFDQAQQAVGHLLLVAEPEFIVDYGRELHRAFGGAVSPEGVRDLIDELVRADPLEQAVWALIERGRDAHQHGGMLHVDGEFSNPKLTVLEALAAAADAPRVGAWAHGRNDGWALGLWAPPDVYVIESSKQGVLWRHFRIGDADRLRMVAHERELPQRLLVPHGAMLHVIPEAEELAARLGLVGLTPPKGCVDGQAPAEGGLL